MISCKVDFNRLYEGGKIAKLYCAGVGIFPVFSGLFPHTNRIGCGGNENGPIPTGKYRIVDRPRGGVRSRLKEYEKHIRTGNDYSSWFALYRQDGLIDDSTYIGETLRRSFRLHPLRPDGTGVSDGCLTFMYHADFDKLRSALLNSHTRDIPIIHLKAYGEIEVTGDMNAPCLIL